MDSSNGRLDEWILSFNSFQLIQFRIRLEKFIFLSLAKIEKAGFFP